MPAAAQSVSKALLIPFFCPQKETNGLSLSCLGMKWMVNNLITDYSALTSIHSVLDVGFQQLYGRT